MKLVTFQRGPGAAEETGILTPAGGIVPTKAAGLPYDSMNDLIAGITPEEWDTLRGAEGPALPPDRSSRSSRGAGHGRHGAGEWVSWRSQARQRTKKGSPHTLRRTDFHVRRVLHL